MDETDESEAGNVAASSKQDREARRRTREYEARLAVHETGVARARRDNVVAAVAFAAIAVLATGSQVWFAAEPRGAAAPDAPAATESAAPERTAPPASLAENRAWTGSIELSAGVSLGVELDGAKAPQAVANMVALTEQGFFDGTPCHRLTTQGLYVLQCGDPTGTGTGGPGYTFGPLENVPADGVYPAGTIAMARAQSPDSMGSQFFIVYQDTTLPGGYTVMGKVTSGLDSLVAKVASAGVQGGGGDGSPAVPVAITAFQLQ